MGFIPWIIVGLIAGVTAKVLMPGSRGEPSGWLSTILLGIIGVVIGVFLSSLLMVEDNAIIKVGGVRLDN